MLALDLRGYLPRGGQVGDINRVERDVLEVAAAAAHRSMHPR